MVIILTEAQARERKDKLIGVISRFGEVTYYAVFTLEEWRTFVKKKLGYY